MRERTVLPSKQRRARSDGKKRRYERSYLNDLPPAGELVGELLFDARHDGGVLALLDAVLCANDYLAGLGLPEQKHLLRREGNNEDWDVILQYLAR